MCKGVGEYFYQQPRRIHRPKEKYPQLERPKSTAAEGEWGESDRPEHVSKQGKVTWINDMTGEPRSANK